MPQTDRAARRGEPQATAADAPVVAPRLTRSGTYKVIGGVCGGLGRYFALDPVIFRVVFGVLAVTGGLGLVAYGLLWLIIPLDGAGENEGRRLLSGRVEGAALTALLFLVVGCGLFLSMLDRGGVLVFAAMLALSTAGAAYWAQHRREAASGDTAVDDVTAQAVADAPPETAPPPVPSPPSWWRDPITKDGVPFPAYLWGPDDGAYEPDSPAARPARQVRESMGIGGFIFLAALAAGAIATASGWGSQPQPTALAFGLACALGVFGLGFVISAWYGRAGGGTVVWALITTLLLAGAVSLPDSVRAEWLDRTWTPSSAAEVRDSYRLGTGRATLDLSEVRLPKGRTLTVRADVGAGRLQVILPDAARTRLRAEVGVGDLTLPGVRNRDVDVQAGQQERTTFEPVGTAPRGTLSLRVHVGVGQVEVDRATP